MDTTQQFAVIFFTLPDDRVVLQRRTKDAPYGADRLGLFGGWIERNETPFECIVRELSEETSLVVNDLDIKFVKDFFLPKDEDFSVDRKFHLFEASIPDLNFKIYEGQRSEALSKEELRLRHDLTGSATFVAKHMLR